MSGGIKNFDILKGWPSSSARDYSLRITKDTIDSNGIPTGSFVEFAKGGVGIPATDFKKDSGNVAVVVGGTELRNVKEIRKVVALLGGYVAMISQLDSGDNPSTDSIKPGTPVTIKGGKLAVLTDANVAADFLKFGEILETRVDPTDATKRVAIIEVK